MNMQTTVSSCSQLKFELWLKYLLFALLSCKISLTIKEAKYAIAYTLHIDFSSLNILSEMNKKVTVKE